MSENQTTEPRTFNASIATLCEFKGFQTVLKLSGTSHESLPLVPVTITLRPGELFKATGSNGKVKYTEDLEDAWRFARYNDADGAPDAVVILSPCTAKNGINSMAIIPIHERAVQVPE